MRDHKTLHLLAELNVYQRALKDLNRAFMQREIMIKERDNRIKELEQELTRYK